MKRIFYILLVGALMLSFIGIGNVQIIANEGETGQEGYSVKDVDPNQWVAVDGLGRTLPVSGEVSLARDRKVGMFFWTWHYNFATSKPFNINNLMLENPEMIHDYSNKYWSNKQASAYFWNEPIYGYYTEMDDYVLRKQAELLADAGVDFIVFDCTNGTYTWDAAFMNLLEVFTEAKEDGVAVPQVAFMLNFGATEECVVAMKNLYKKLYQKELYKDLWFYWEGKPLIMGYPEALDKTKAVEKEISEFFTFKRNVPSYFEPDKTDDYWGWLHIYPQALYKNDDGSIEMTTVGVAMNADSKAMALCAMNGENIMGRSFSMGDYSYSYKYRGKTIKVDSNIENSSYYGINLQQQWDYAIEKDPELVFVTGWNEWIMGRFETWCGVDNAFPDQFNDEYSRDIEPSAGKLKDYYYYQLVTNIRRYKGMDIYANVKAYKTIDISGDLTQWDDAENVETYYHYTDSTYNRDDKGWSGYSYENATMRNDIVETKLAYDSENVYFYVKTEDKLSPSSDPAWMRLFIDTKVADASSVDWEEYEYVINRESPSADTACLERSTGGWNFEKVADVKYTVNDNVLQLCVPLESLGLTSDNMALNFKWSDNMQEDGNILDFYLNGDVAPGGRFMFAYSSVSKHGADGSDNKGGINKNTIIICVAAVVAVAATASAAVVVIKSKKTT